MELNMERQMTDQKKRKPGRPKKSEQSPPQRRVKIGVSVEETIWRKLRALALTEGVLTSELLDKAIKEFLDKHQ